MATLTLSNMRNRSIIRAIILILSLYLIFLVLSHFTRPSSSSNKMETANEDVNPALQLYTKKPTPTINNRDVSQQQKIDPNSNNNNQQRQSTQQQEQQQQLEVTGDMYADTHHGDTNYAIATVSRDNYAEFLNIFPCVRRRFKNHVIVTFGLNLDQTQINQLEDLHSIHYVSIPSTKFADQLKKDGSFEIPIWSNIVKKLGKRFTENYANGDRFHVSDLSRLCDNSDQVSSTENRLEKKKFGLVVPFIDKQVNNLAEQLQRWSELEYTPCQKNQNLDHKFDLVFFYHKEYNATLQDFLLSKLSQRTQLCFDRIIFRYAQLLPKEDKYPIAANYMFYRLVHDPLFHTKYRFMFYSEPDTWALRPNWLSVLERISYGHPEQFWVKGSIYRGPRRDLGRLSVNIHVNGNAIYSLTDDYLLFLYRVQSSMPIDSYDVAQTRLLFRDPSSLRAFWHKFVFSEFIQNLWQVKWSERQIKREFQECYFVHGKTKMSAEEENKNLI
jgi:hypothetical protein